MTDYVWHPNEPASGDIGMHGIYSFRDVIRSREEYGYDSGTNASLLFGKVKIWGEIVEHEAGYRSQFGKIVSLDYGDLELLEKFRKIYRVNQVSAGWWKPEGHRLRWTRKGFLLYSHHRNHPAEFAPLLRAQRALDPPRKRGKPEAFRSPCECVPARRPHAYRLRRLHVR